MKGPRQSLSNAAQQPSHGLARADAWAPPGQGGKQKQGKAKGNAVSVIPKAGQGRPPYAETDVIMHNLLLVESYYRQIGRPILEDVDIADMAAALFAAPFAILAHNAFEANDPVFVYANQTALDLFEAEWSELVGRPSRLAADEADQVERQELMAAAAGAGKGGHAFSAWRRSLKGTRFRLADATLFNVMAPNGERVGQATVIRRWEFEDGTQGGPGVPPPREHVSDAQLAEADAAVEEQAAAVRALKEDQQRGNADPEVKAAVAVLLARKEVAEKLRARRAEEHLVAAVAQRGGEWELEALD